MNKTNPKNQKKFNNYNDNKKSLSDENSILLEWEILLILWWWKYKVKLLWMDNVIVEWYLSWKMKKNKIKLITWDYVNIELNQFDMLKWRIVFRKTWK